MRVCEFAGGVFRDLEELEYFPGLVLRNSFIGAYARRDMTSESHPHTLTNLTNLPPLSQRPWRSLTLSRRAEQNQLLSLTMN